MLLQPMKPAKLNLDKPSHQEKLENMFSSFDYIAEPKIDGCHYFCDSGRFLSTRISSSTGELVDKTDNFPHLVEGFLKAGLGRTVLDGEIYYPGTSNSYSATKVTGCLGPEAIRRQEEEFGWIYYMVFDVLRDPEGYWLFSHPWKERRAILEEIGVKLTQTCKYFHIIPVIRSNKQRFLEKTLADGKEGIIFKHVSGVYIPGKRPMDNWVKYKTGLEDDVILIGFESPVKEYTGKDATTWPYWEDEVPVTKHYYMGWIGSIRFGKYTRDGELVELGSCTGIDDAMRKEFTVNSDEYVGRVIKIKAMEMTADGKYRHPNFIEVHPDKNAFECVIDEVV